MVQWLFEGKIVGCRGDNMGVFEKIGYIYIYTHETVIYIKETMMINPNDLEVAS